MALASLLLSLGVAEWILVRFYPLGTNIIEAHPEFLFAYRADSRKMFVHHPANGGSVLVRINQDGFREPELRRPPGAPRIVVYGDSFMAGEFSEYENTFAAQLEAALRDRGADAAEVINAGVAGYGPDQAFLRMRDELAELKPDFVLLAIFSGNDHGDLVRNKLLGRDGRFSRPELSDRMRSKLEERKSGWQRLALVRAVTRFWELQNPEPLAITDYVERSLDWSSQEYESYRRDDRVEELFLDHYDADLALFPQGDAALIKERLMRQLLVEVARWAETSVTPLAVVTIPAAIDVVPDYDLHVDRDRYPQYDRRRLSRLAEAAAVDAGLPSINLYDSFEAEDARQLYFRHGDNHWNDEGQRLAACVVASALERWGGLDPWRAPTRATPLRCHEDPRAGSG